MAYEPTVWETGDIITAEKLNKIENAIGGIYYVDIPTEGDALSVTWQDIYDAYQSGKSIVGRFSYEDSDDIVDIEFAKFGYISNASEGRFEVGFMNIRNVEYPYISDSATGQLIFNPA